MTKGSKVCEKELIAYFIYRSFQETKKIIIALHTKSSHLIISSPQIFKGGILSQVTQGHGAMTQESKKL